MDPVTAASSEAGSGITPCSGATDLDGSSTLGERRRRKSKWDEGPSSAPGADPVAAVPSPSSVPGTDPVAAVPASWHDPVAAAAARVAAMKASKLAASTLLAQAEGELLAARVAALKATTAVSSPSNLDSTTTRKSKWDEAPDQTSTQSTVVAEAPAQPDLVEQVLLMQDRQVGNMIGPNGCNVRKIKEQTHVNIRVGPTQAGVAEVFISGNRGDVDRAEAMIRSSLAARKCPLAADEDLAALKEKAAKSAKPDDKMPDFVGTRSRRKLRLGRRLQELIKRKQAEESCIAISEGTADDDLVASMNTKGRDLQSMLSRYHSECAGLWKTCQREGSKLTQAEDVGPGATGIWQAKWKLAAPTLSEIEEISSAFDASIATMKEKNDKERASWFAAHPKQDKQEKGLTAQAEAQLLKCMQLEGWTKVEGKGKGKGRPKRRAGQGADKQQLTAAEDQVVAGDRKGAREENVHDEHHVGSGPSADGPLHVAHVDLPMFLPSCSTARPSCRDELGTFQDEDGEWPHTAPDTEDAFHRQGEPEESWDPPDEALDSLEEASDLPEEASGASEHAWEPSEEQWAAEEALAESAEALEESERSLAASKVAWRDPWGTERPPAAEVMRRKPYSAKPSIFSVKPKSGPGAARRLPKPTVPRLRLSHEVMRRSPYSAKPSTFSAKPKSGPGAARRPWQSSVHPLSNEGEPAGRLVPRPPKIPPPPSMRPTRRPMQNPRTWMARSSRPTTRSRSRSSSPPAGWSQGPRSSSRSRSRSRSWMESTTTAKVEQSPPRLVAKPKVKAKAKTLTGRAASPSTLTYKRKMLAAERPWRDASCDVAGEEEERVDRPRRKFSWEEAGEEEIVDEGDDWQDWHTAPTQRSGHGRPASKRRKRHGRQ